MGNLSTLRRAKTKLPVDSGDNIFDDLRKTFFNDLRLLSFEPFNYHNNSFPPYNIYENGEDEFVIEMALAGYSKNDIEIIVENNILKVSSNKIKDSSEKDVNYHYRGIAKRSFTNQFQLAEFAEVKDCSMKNGILRVNIVRIVPEEKRPKVIEIK